MNEFQKPVFAMLDRLTIHYKVVNHPAVFTIEQMESEEIFKHGDVCKNLFLRDDKGKNHFLVVLDKDKKADLKAIAQQIGSTKLSFASEERLKKFLGLEKGSVSPLGVINDTVHAVSVIIDSDLVGKENLGVHPNDNTASVFLSYDSLEKYMNECGNTITVINL